jgi:hypothetical protein
MFGDDLTEAIVYLSSALQRLDLLLHREILRLRATYQLSLDEFRGLYISDEQVNRLIDRALNHEGPTSAIDELTRRAEALRITGEHENHDQSPWRCLATEFSLRPTEQDILLLALAPELNLKYETLYAYLNNDVTRKWPTCDLTLRLLSHDPQGRINVQRCLMPDAALFSSGLLQWLSSTPGRPSWLAGGFSVSSAVLHYLSGIHSLDSRLALFAEQRAPTATWEQIPLPPDKLSALRRVINLLSSSLSNQSAPLVVFDGREGSGRGISAEAICRTLNLALLRVDLDTLRGSSEDVDKLVQAILLQQRLHNAALYLEKCETLFDKERKPLPEGRRLLKSLMKSRRPVFMACEPNTRWRELTSASRTVSFHFDNPDYAGRLQLWEASLARMNVTVARPDLEALADRFVLSAGQITSAIAAAVDEQVLISDPAAETAAPDKTSSLGSKSLFAAARAQSDQSLGNLAVRVRLIHSWQDLILTRVSLQRVKEVAAAIKYRHVVYSDWGFAERIAAGQGLKALFAGASGTGKTMTAGVIARELGLDLYKIDLSAIVSKYIGETEKNLDSIFRAAQASNSILFFDEADALFGKRSEVKDAHDRYANIEVAYLLQKIEEYEGVVILASNLSKNIDDAFARRMHYVVEFPMPDETHREQLWRGMFPAQVPLGDDVDFSFIAKQFSITGGDIRNVALDAAFLAAQDGKLVTMKQLIQALARQMIKQGRIPSPTDFKQYHELIAQER